MKVTGEGRMKESITRRRQAPSIATIGSTCDLNLKIPGRSLEEPGWGKWWERTGLGQSPPVGSPPCFLTPRFPPSSWLP